MLRFIPIIILCLPILTTASNTAVDVSPCTKVQSQLEKVLSLRFVVNNTNAKQICSLTASATGAQVETILHKNFLDILNSTNKVFTDQSWHENAFTKKLAADGVYSTQFAFVKDQLLALINVQVTGSDYSKCPSDEPLDIYQNCQLEPQQRLYKVKITISQQPRLLTQP